MQLCYDQTVEPIFRGSDDSCEDVGFDLDLSGEVYGKSDAAISAAVIMLHSNARALNREGWWGDQFLDFPLGNRAWAIQNGADLGTDLETEIQDVFDRLVGTGEIGSFDIQGDTVNVYVDGVGYAI